MNVGIQSHLMPVEELLNKVQIGDIIESPTDKAPGAFHMAIYIGEGIVIHVTGENPESAAVEEDSYMEYFEGRPVRINNSLDNQHEPRSAAEIVELAKSQVGDKWSYRLTEYNCQHFACLVRNNVLFSHDAEAAKSTAKKTCGFSLGGVTFFALLAMLIGNKEA